MALKGWIDSYSRGGIAGWALETEKPYEPIPIDIYIGSRHYGRALADRHRPDLEEAGYGDGRKAFFFAFPTGALPADAAVDVEVRYSGGVELVPNGLIHFEPPPVVNPWDGDSPYDYSTLWLDANLCKRHINRTVSGDPEVGPFTHMIRKYILRRGWRKLRRSRTLILGSSEGKLERELCQAGFTGEIIATDVALNALERASEQAEQLGYHNIRHIQHDLNQPIGEKFGGQFDFIFAEGVLHHIGNIRTCLESCNDLLKPDGYLFAKEFEGPFRFQLSELQARWINAALTVLPRDLRPFPDQNREPKYPGSREDNDKIFFVVPSEESVVAADPSEALTGPDLKQMIPEIFEIADRKAYGGTLLSYMTNHFDFKRSNTDRYAEQWLKVLMEIERTLIETGILDDEFVTYVLRKKLCLY